MAQDGQTMTPGQYAKIKRIADDERADFATREAAQRQVERWRTRMEGAAAQASEKKLHPGMELSPEYKAWAKDMKVGNRERK
jgi:hypothetical protein